MARLEQPTLTVDDLIRSAALCEEALRLARILAHRLPVPPVLGLLALMELQASRAAARVDAQGVPVLLDQQNRARWDWLQIERGQQVLARDLALLVLGIAGQGDDLHPVEQRLRQVQRVRGGHEHDVRQVDVDLQVVVLELAVLLGVEHLQQC